MKNVKLALVALACLVALVIPTAGQQQITAPDRRSRPLSQLIAAALQITTALGLSLAWLEWEFSGS